MHDLEAFAAPVVERLPLVPQEEELILSAETLPVPPPELKTTVIGAGAAHALVCRGNVYYDRVYLGGERSALRSLGVLVFAAVLHERDVVLHLVGPLELGSRRLSRLRIQAAADGADDPPPHALGVRACAYSYWPSPDRGLHPFLDRGVYPALDRDLLPHQLPTIEWEVNFTGYPNPETSDEAIGFGGPGPSCLLAELLLDLGHPDSPDSECVLEGSNGFQGVSPGSAELVVATPSSMYYPVRTDPRVDS